MARKPKMKINFLKGAKQLELVEPITHIPFYAKNLKNMVTANNRQVSDMFLQKVQRFFLQPNGSVNILPGQRAIFGTRMSFEMPEGYELEMRLSGTLVFRKGLVIANSPAYIDWTYNSEARVILLNVSQRPVPVKKNEFLGIFVVRKREFMPANVEYFNEDQYQEHEIEEEDVQIVIEEQPDGMEERKMD